MFPPRQTTWLVKINRLKDVGFTKSRRRVFRPSGCRKCINWRVLPFKQIWEKTRIIFTKKKLIIVSKHPCMVHSVDRACVTQKTVI